VVFSDSAGWSAGLHGTGLHFHVQIVSLPLFTFPLLEICAGGGSGCSLVSNLAYIGG